jgi:hypothetical protein
MKVIAKELIPNKSWILKNKNKKVGTLLKDKKGYFVLQNGVKTLISDVNSMYDNFEIISLSNTKKKNLDLDYSIYNYPCRIKPFNPTFNLKKKLPLYSKNATSKSIYCAGYYIIKFQKKWVQSFCPKLITLDRYPYQGPFKTEKQARQSLLNINHHETTEHHSH